jgi:hypothetical protein
VIRTSGACSMPLRLSRSSPACRYAVYHTPHKCSVDCNNLPAVSECFPTGLWANKQTPNGTSIRIKICRRSFPEGVVSSRYQAWSLYALKAIRTKDSVFIQRATNPQTYLHSSSLQNIFANREITNPNFNKIKLKVCNRIGLSKLINVSRETLGLLSL